MLHQSENADERALYTQTRAFAKTANFSIASGKAKYAISTSDLTVKHS
jgi:hypothetical protein